MKTSLSPAARCLWKFEQRCKWLALGILWLAVGIPCLWWERATLGRLWESFTWAGLRILLFGYRHWTGLGILICVGFTLSTFISASFYEMWGVMPWEAKALEKQVSQIRHAGSRHPLWRVIQR